MQTLVTVKEAEQSEGFKKCDLHLDSGVRGMIIEQMECKPKFSFNEMRYVNDTTNSRLCC